MVGFLLSLLLTLSEFTLPLEYKKLDNGLLVIVSEDHTVPLVSVQVWYKVGSKYERYGKTGISHMLEHMMFKGTEKMAPREYNRFIESIGGTENAYTSKERTVYWSVVPAKYLEKMMEIEADRMVNCTFQEFESERNVVAEERRWSRENSPMGRLWEAFFSTLFRAHPYRHPVIGWMSDIENYTVDDVREHYEKYYAPNNAALIVVGDVNKDEVFKLAEKYFGKIKKRAHPDSVITRETDWEEVRTVTLVGENYPEILYVGYVVPGYNHEDNPALDVLSYILGRSMSSRLDEALVETGIATRAFAFLYVLHDYSVFTIGAYPSPGVEHDSVLKVIDREIEKIQKEGVKEEELKKAFNILYTSFITGAQSLWQRGNLIGDYYIKSSNPEGVNLYLKRIKKVTLEDVQKVAREYLNPYKRTIIYMKTKKGEGK